MPFVIDPLAPARAGDLLFYRPGRGFTDLFGQLIALATHSDVCHVEIDLGDGRTIGSHARGVEITTGGGAPAYRVRLGDVLPDMGVALGWALAHEGKRYDALSIVSYTLRLLQVPISVSARDAFTCSEFAAHVVDLAGDDALKGKLALLVEDGFDTVSPGALLGLFQELDAEAAKAGAV